MEFNELKRGWRQLDLERVKYSKEELDSIFEVRTKRNISKINKSMLVDAILMMITAGFLIFTTFILNLQSRYLVSLEILGFVFVMLVHYKIKYTLINRQPDFESEDLLSGISVIVKRIKNYVLAYKLIVPLIICALYARFNYTASLDINYLWLLAPIFLGGFLIVHWTCRLMYGKALGELLELRNKMV